MTTPNSQTQPTFREALAVSAFFSFTLLCFGPAQIYLTNSLEFPFAFLDVAFPLLALPVVLALLLARLLLSVPRRVYARGLAVLLILAGLLWFQGNVLVWDYGVLDGRDIEWSAHRHRGMADSLIWLGLLVFAWTRPTRLRRFSKQTSLFFLLLQTATVLVLFARSPDRPSFHRYRYDRSRQYTFSSTRNVIILVLDGYQSPVFQEFLDREPAWRSAFDGFTYFRNAVAGCSVTQGSVPNMLTGLIYDNSVPYLDFVQDAYLSPSSLPRMLKENRFRVDVYTIYKAALFDDRVMDNLAKRRASLVENMPALAMLADVSLFRQAPHFVKKLIWNEHAWLVSSLVGRPGDQASSPARKFRRLPVHEMHNLPFIEEMTAGARVDDEAVGGKPTFKFYHIMGPHPPLTINERMEPESLPFNPRNYRKAAKGCLELTRLFVAKLKEIGVYDNSFILIVSDHGMSLPIAQPAPGGVECRPAQEDRVPTGVLTRSLALVLVKPFLARGPLETSDAPVWLGDLPRTVAESLGLPADTLPGQSMLSIPEDARRSRLYRSVNDIHWEKCRYLSRMTEYEIDGFSWNPTSWRKTGRIFGDCTEALAVFYQNEKGVHLGFPSAYTESAGTQPYMLIDNQDLFTMYFLNDKPRRGDRIGLDIPLRKLKKGARYQLSVDVYDNCSLSLPGLIVQTVRVGDGLIERHDIGAPDGYSGWRNVQGTFVPQARTTNLRLETMACETREELQGWKWLSRTSYRNLDVARIVNDRSAGKMVRDP